MCLTIIGAMGSISSPASPTSCYLVQCLELDPLAGEIWTWSIVLEMGPGSLGALRHHIDPRIIDALVFSRTRASHMGDITSLQVFRRWGPGSDLEFLSLAGPIGILERIRQIDGAHLPDTYGGEFDIHTVRAGQNYRIGPMTLTPFPGIHTVESLGTRIVGSSDSSLSRTASMFPTGDVDEAPAILEGIRGVDLSLVKVNSIRTDTVRGIHMDGMCAGRLAARAEAACPVAVHIQPRTNLKTAESELREHRAGPLNFAISQRAFIVGQWIFPSQERVRTVLQPAASRRSS